MNNFIHRTGTELAFGRHRAVTELFTVDGMGTIIPPGDLKAHRTLSVVLWFPASGRGLTCTRRSLQVLIP